MSTPHQADLLARWLDQRTGLRADPPAGLDPDVVEAVLALRPDRAPAARVSIEDVLAQVRQGPLAAEPPASHAADPDASAEIISLDAAREQRESPPDAVAALADWLDDLQAIEPPPHIDPDVEQAIYALRPDRAPAPRVGIDDILGAVTTGPFADASGLAEASGPAEEAPQDTVISLDTERRRRLRWWALPGLGAVAVAATALLFVLPVAQQAMQRPDPFSEAETARSAPPSAAASPVASPEVVDSPTLKSASAKSASASEPQPAKAASPRLTDASDVASGSTAATGQETATIGGVSDKEAPAGLGGLVAGRGVMDEDAFGMNEAGEGGGGASLGLDASLGYGAGMGRAAVSGAVAPAPVASAPVAPAPVFEERKRAEQAPASQTLASEHSSVSTRSSDDDADGPTRGSATDAVKNDGAISESLSDQRDQGVSDAIPVTESSREGRSRRSSKLKKSAPARRVPASAPEMDRAEVLEMEEAPAEAFDDLVAPEATAPQASAVTGDDIASLRQRAWPLSPVPDVRVGRPEVAEAYARADAATDRQGVVDALRPLLSHPVADVAMDAAWRIARRELDAGRTASALAAIASGLGRSGGQRVFRARLLALQGEVMERRGDPEAAMQLYEDAIRAQ